MIDLIQLGGRVRGQVRPRAQQVRVPPDREEDVVDIVSEASRERSDAFHALQRLLLLARGDLLGHVEQQDHQVQDRAVHRHRLHRHRDEPLTAAGNGEAHLVRRANLLRLDRPPQERLERLSEVREELAGCPSEETNRRPRCREELFEERGSGRVVLDHDLGSGLEDQERRRQRFDHLPVQKQTILHSRQPRRDARDAHLYIG